MRECDYAIKPRFEFAAFLVQLQPSRRRTTFTLGSFVSSAQLSSTNVVAYTLLARHVSVSDAFACKVRVSVSRLVCVVRTKETAGFLGRGAKVRGHASNIVVDFPILHTCNITRNVMICERAGFMESSARTIRCLHRYHEKSHDLEDAGALESATT